MISNVAEAEIVEMYDTLEMSVKEIAYQLDLDELAVKAILAQRSQTYRAQALATNAAKAPAQSDPLLPDMPIVGPVAPNSPAASEDNFLTADERQQLRDNMLSLAMTSENDTVRAKMSIWLFEESKGRNEARVKNLSKMQPTGVSVQQLNIQIIESRKTLAAIREKAKEAINV